MYEGMGVAVSDKAFLQRQPADLSLPTPALDHPK